MEENIQYSYEWLEKEIFKTKLKQAQTGKKIMFGGEKTEILKLIQQFIKLNKEIK